MIEFFVHGTPKPQPRPRAVARGKHARVYDPGTADEWKKAVRAACPKVANPDGQCVVDLAFFFERPKSHKKRDGSLRDSAPMVHVYRPDLDNLAKAVMDAMADAGVWSDDAQVVRLDVAKFYADYKNEPPGCRVTVRGRYRKNPCAPGERR